MHDTAPEIPGPQIAIGMAVISGAIILFMGLANLGFIIDLIPLPSIASFMTGSAILICSGQAKTLLGETANFDLDVPAYQIIIDTLKNLPSSKRYDAAMGVSALVLLYGIRSGCNYAARRYSRRAKIFFFICNLRKLFVILFFTMISAVVNFQRESTPIFDIVGHIPRGFDHAGVPSLNADVIKAFLSKLPAAVMVMLLEHIATSKSYSRINNYTINPSQELIAIGVTNLLGPFIGGFPATGALSRSTIQSKAGVRTPMAGIITALVVLVAIYALTAVLFYIPHASLSAVIIHAVADLIAPPNMIYQFWLISPLDAVLFAVGLVIAIVNTIPNSIYVTACLSLAILLFRHAKAHGSFVHRTWIGENDSRRPLFLPVSDTSNSMLDIKVETMRPGVFIYRFSESLSYPNVSHSFHDLVQDVLKSTRPTQKQEFTKKGDRPWNDPSPADKTKQTVDSQLPILRAVILDFSAVNHVDVTSIQGLIDVRNQLNRRATPLEVQWHFASVQNRWTKRALAAAGFGYPPRVPEVIVDGQEVQEEAAEHTKPKDLENAMEEKPDQEGDHVEESQEKRICRKDTQWAQSTARPFFHVDLTSALEAVDAHLDRNPCP